MSKNSVILQQSKMPHKTMLRLDCFSGEMLENLKKYQEEDIEKASITPRTFIDRDFCLCPDQAELDSRAYVYIDTYECNTNQVSRYGINAMSCGINEMSILNNNLKVINLPEENSSSSATKSSKSISSSSSKSSKSFSAVQQVKHHKIEKYLLQQAINSLFEHDKYKTVLVDIFAREGELIKILPNNCPETHTVVLYKNPIENDKHKVLVIDPSNFSFSSHLSNDDISQSVKHDLLEKIITMHKTTQIYKPNDKKNLGPNHDNYRDCVDIAVKIAFVLNNFGEAIAISPPKKPQDAPTFDLNILTCISNDPSIDQNIITLNLPTRIKQTSDINIIQKFYKIEQSISKNLELALLLDQPNLNNQIKSTYQTILEQYTANNDILNSLVHCNQTCITGLFNVMNVQQNELAKLVGEQNDNFTEGAGI